VITVDGEAINPIADDNPKSIETIVSETRVELKLCRALAALNPPLDLSVILHARAAELLKALRRYDATDQDVIPAEDLSDTDLKQAASFVRAFRALPSWGTKGFQGGVSFRSILGEYALELADEIDSRTKGIQLSRCSSWGRTHGAGKSSARRVADEDRGSHRRTGKARTIHPQRWVAVPSHGAAGQITRKSALEGLFHPD
jgi:hypothetical protein